MAEQKFAYHLGFGEVIRILRLVDETPFEELRLELGDFKLHVVQEGKERPPAGPPAKVSEPAPQTVHERAEAAAPMEEPIDGTPVLAPLAGTFYRAPAPGAPTFVEVGKAVK